MEIVIEIPVFERVYKNDFDRILLYDNITGEFTVADYLTGEVRKHQAGINAENLSFAPIHFLTNCVEVIKYLYRIGVRDIYNIPDEIFKKINTWDSEEMEEYFLNKTGKIVENKFGYYRDLGRYVYGKEQSNHS